VLGNVLHPDLRFLAVEAIDISIVPLEVLTAAPQSSDGFEAFGWFHFGLQLCWRFLFSMLQRFNWVQHIFSSWYLHVHEFSVSFLNSDAGLTRQRFQFLQTDNIFGLPFPLCGSSLPTFHWGFVDLLRSCAFEDLSNRFLQK